MAGWASRVGLYVFLLTSLTFATARSVQYEPIDLGSLAGDITPVEWADKHPESTARGINDLGQVVGSSIVSWTGLDPATDSPIEHAFVWTPQAGMVDLGTLIGGPAATGGTSMASAINGLGQVVGWSETALGGVHGIIVTPEDSDGDGAPDLWFRDDDLDGVNDLMVDLGTLGGADSRAFYVNDLGQVVGESTTVLGEMHGFLWAAAQGMSDLGVLGGLVEFSSSASHVSDSGQVVGQSTTDMGEIHAYQRTAEGAMEDLGTLGGLLESWSDARAVNEGGQVVGTSLSDGGQEHAFLWSTNDGMVDLGTLGLLPGSSSSASDINAVGQVVGTSTTDTSESHAFLWTPSGGMIDLGTLGGASSEATSVNDLGQVVGSSKTAAGEDRAFVWTAEDGLRDLGTLGGSTSSATSVNGVGQVAGAGTTLQGFTHAAVFAITAASNADMSVSVVSAPATAQVGGIVEYRFRVENGGPDTANGVAFSFSFPSAILRRTSIGFQAGNGFSCSGNACSGGIMQSGDFNTFTLEFAVEAAGTAVVAADVTADARDPDVGNNSSSATTEISVPTTADIALTKQAVFDRFDPTPDELNIEEQFFYDLVVTNNGPDVAPGVTITDLLPPEVSFTTFGAVNQFLTCETTSRVGRICTNGDSVRCGHAVDGAPEGSISCSVLNTIEVGESRTARIRVEAVVPGTFANTALSAIADLTDPVAGNNGASVTTTIVPPPNSPPVADARSVTAEGRIATSITLTGSDPDGDAITFAIVSAPANGTLTGTAPNLTYTSDPGFTGTDSFTFKANDGQVDSNVATVTITVVDTTPPALTAPPDVTAEATALDTPVDIGTASATDLVDGAIMPSNDAPAAGFPLGVTVFTWSATDASGNTATATQSVTVVDTTAPVVTAPGDITAEANAVLSTLDIGQATATDIFPVSVDNDAPSAGFPLGTTTVTWTVTDTSGNKATATQSVTIVDTTPPVLNLPANVTAEANAALSTVDIGQATAADIFPVTITNDAPAGFPLGTTVVTWTATDTSGNAASATQNVTVVDTTPPVLTVPPDVTVTASGALTQVDIGTATASDIFPVTIDNDAPAAGFPIGVTEVTWTATDANGNSASAVQTVRAEFAFGGFLTPLRPSGIYKLGRTLPLKFQLFFADGSPALTATAMLQLQQLAAGEPVGDPIEAESTSAADSGNIFRLADSKYLFNLATKPLSKGSFRVLVTLNDGSSPKAIDIGFK